MKFWMMAFGLGTALSAFAGTDRGNPGDEYAIAFANLGYDLAENLAKDPVPGVDAAGLLAAVRKTVLHSEDTLALRGFPVDAINYPDATAPQIVISRQGWDRMAAEPHRRVFLAFHEYLAILGIDDSSYQVSNLLDRAKVCDRTAELRKVIEWQVKRSCYRIVPDDLVYLTELEVTLEGPQPTLKDGDLWGFPNLRNFHVTSTNPLVVGANTFPSDFNITWLMINSPSLDLGDCSFLHPLAKLEDLFLDAPSPISHIQAGCFASNSNLKFLSLSVDGESTALPGFLNGVNPALVVDLSGDNTDKIPLAEYAPIHKLSLYQRGRSFSDAFQPALEAQLGQTCLSKTFPGGVGHHLFCPPSLAN